MTFPKRLLVFVRTQLYRLSLSRRLALSYAIFVVAAGSSLLVSLGSDLLVERQISRTTDISTTVDQLTDNIEQKIVASQLKLNDLIVQRTLIGVPDEDAPGDALETLAGIHGDLAALHAVTAGQTDTHLVALRQQTDMFEADLTRLEERVEALLADLDTLGSENQGQLGDLIAALDELDAQAEASGELEIQLVALSALGEAQGFLVDGAPRHIGAFHSNLARLRAVVNGSPLLTPDKIRDLNMRADEVLEQFDELASLQLRFDTRHNAFRKQAVELQTAVESLRQIGRSEFEDSFAAIETAQRLNQATQIVMVVLLLVFIPITWGLAAFITSSITEPIGKLAQATTELAGGNLDHRIWLPGQKANELGALAIAFNNMADQLQDTIESLERYREHLEELVVERTHELQNVNQNLQREITERKQAEAQQGKLLQELVRSNKELEEFAYVASHDMQEPLRMIASYLKLLEKHYKGQLDPEANKFITYAVDGAKRMQQLINDLLRYSRVGTQEKLFAPTDCESVLEQALTNLRLKINDHQATITYDTLPTVVADQAQLLQLFQNLLGNAIKFHGRHPPEIHVGAVKRNGDWLFSVKDNGIGIEPEDTEHIFDIFQRLHHRGEYEGTGIGLAICKKIVERHDGRIWVESKPEQGAKFLFTIPQRDS